MPQLDQDRDRYLSRRDIPRLAVTETPSGASLYLFDGSAIPQGQVSVIREVDPTTGGAVDMVVVKVPLSQFETIDFARLEQLAQ